MEWSNEERKVVEELSEMPAFRLSYEQRQTMRGAVQRQMQQARRRRRTLIAGGAVSVAAAVVLIVGLWQSGALPGIGGGTVSGGLGQPSQSQQMTFVAEFQIKALPGETITEEGLDSTIEALIKRADVAGLNPVQMEKILPDRVKISAGGTFDHSAAVQMFMKEAKIEFRSPDGSVLATGKDLKPNARLFHDQSGQRPVLVEFKNATLLQEITKTYRGQQVSIWLDGVMLANPTVQEEVSNGQVTLAVPEATQMANLINAGALPYQVEVVQPDSAQ